MTHALCQDTRAKQQTKSVVNVSYRPTFSSAAEVDCTQWRLSSVTALPLLSFYVFFFILQDFIFHSVKIYIWFISSFSVKYLQMSNSFLWSSVNMQHKKIVASLCCVTAQTCIFVRSTGVKRARVNREITPNELKSRLNFSVHEI